MRFWTAMLALLLPGLAAIAGVGSLANGPFKPIAPQVYVIQNGKVERSSGDTVIEQSIVKLWREYKIRITQIDLAGYVLNIDQDGTDPSYAGFDFGRTYSNSFFSPWFHNPAPGTAESRAMISCEWRYATSGVDEAGCSWKISGPVALWEISHVFIPISYFKTSANYNPDGKSTDRGLESVLHEAIHIWHSRHQQKVTKLLRSKGSYYDRARTSETICRKYLEVSYQGGSKSACGFENADEAMRAIIKAAGWPQRWGDLSKRSGARFGKGACRADEVAVGDVDGAFICKIQNFDLGDLHALDNEMEYFAILMQLYVFSPKDFDVTATKNEANFAHWFFSTQFSDEAKNE